MAHILGEKKIGKSFLVKLGSNKNKTETRTERTLSFGAWKKFKIKNLFDGTLQKSQEIFFGKTFIYIRIFC